MKALLYLLAGSFYGVATWIVYDGHSEHAHEGAVIMLIVAVFVVGVVADES